MMSERRVFHKNNTDNQPIEYVYRTAIIIYRWPDTAPQTQTDTTHVSEGKYDVSSASPS